MCSPAKTPQSKAPHLAPSGFYILSKNSKAQLRCSNPILLVKVPVRWLKVSIVIRMNHPNNPLNSHSKSYRYAKSQVRSLQNAKKLTFDGLSIFKQKKRQKSTCEHCQRLMPTPSSLFWRFLLFMDPGDPQYAKGSLRQSTKDYWSTVSPSSDGKNAWMFTIYSPQQAINWPTKRYLCCWSKTTWHISSKRQKVIMVLIIVLWLSHGIKLLAMIFYELPIAIKINYSSPWLFTIFHARRGYQHQGFETAHVVLAKERPPVFQRKNAFLGNLWAHSIDTYLATSQLMRAPDKKGGNLQFAVTNQQLLLVRGTLTHRIPKNLVTLDAMML